VRILGTVKGTRRDEVRLHRKLRRFNLRGEWYSLPPKIAWAILEVFGRKVLPLEAFGAKGLEDVCNLGYQLKTPADERGVPWLQ
jgi:hypothetical protein